MNRLIALLLSICPLLVLAASNEGQIYEPTRDIFAPTAAASPSQTAAPTSKKPVVLSAEQQAAASAASSAVSVLASAGAAKIATLQLYSQDELLGWIAKHQHLKRVLADECQLVPDIEARAKVMMLPSYQYLWADMLLTGTCVDKDATTGVDYMWSAAQHGLPAALLRLAQYYEKGRYVQQDKRQAVVLMHEAAALGYLEARMEWVAMLDRGLGSPLDYEEAYSWLHHSVISDDQQHARATRLLRQLAARMPANVVARAKTYKLD
ncbi:MAG: tetratricopeptide repeat protein [Aeromonadaceae bacterium]